jgi:hypothetical protein
MRPLEPDRRVSSLTLWFLFGTCTADAQEASTVLIRAGRGSGILTYLA